MRSKGEGGGGGLRAKEEEEEKKKKKKECLGENPCSLSPRTPFAA